MKLEREVVEETGAERNMTDALLRALPRVQVPQDLNLRLRLAISHERVRRQSGLLGRISDRAELFALNTLRPLAVHFSVATLALVAVLGSAVMLSSSADRSTVEANDLPLVGFSSPRFIYAQSSAPFATEDGQPLTVAVRVNAEGKVYDYRVLAGTLDAEGAARLRQRMLSSVFAPARIFGEPVRGRAVLTFTDVVVHP